MNDTALHNACRIAAMHVLEEILKEARKERGLLTGNEIASIMYKAMREQKEI